MLTWTATQARRLNELNAAESDFEATFKSASGREKAFQNLEKRLIKLQRDQLDLFRTTHMRPALCRLEDTLTDVMVKNGFSQVTTPIIMSRGVLKKMAIDLNHPLSSQIYWLDNKRALRPMLAPHLYYILVDLLRVWERPVRIFEIGPCFRKETKGSQHASEFTMLNLVEMGTPIKQREAKIKKLASLVSEAAGVSDYHFTTETSEVYGDTIDVVAGESCMEIASSAMGPHILDRPWKINESWIGIGFGLERLLMAAHHSNTLARFGRSLAYLDGIRLNI
jgi:phenylalanyl-tRNA synthetase alpha chain